MTFTAACGLLLIVGFGATPSVAPDTASWVPVPGRCMEFIYGEDPGAWAPGAKPDDHWVTVAFEFGDSSDCEFGWMTPSGFVSAADPGSTVFRAAVPPGSVMLWAVRRPAGLAGPAGPAGPGQGEILTLERAGAIALDLSSAVAAGRSLDPRVERTYYGRAMLHFDLDGDGIPDRAIRLVAEPPRGFLPCACPAD